MNVKVLSSILMITFSFPLLSQNSDFVDKWERSASYMLDIAESMPDSLYTYKPTSAQMTFAEQLEHIAGNIVELTSDYIKDEPTPKLGNHLPENISKAKRAKEYIKNAFEYSTDALKTVDRKELDVLVEDFFAGPKSKRQIIYLLIDHQAHHRGQLVVYLRLNGIKPPRYVGW